MSSLTTWPLNRKQTVALLRHWNVGEFVFLREAAGTASPAVIVATRRGQYFLKQRSPRYSDRARLSYDHSLMRHLARAGLPVIPALRTHEGSRWVVEEGRVYEVYPWVEGRPFDPESRADLVAAADLLARFHQATAGFTPAGKKDLPRLFHPADRLPEIAEARALLEEGIRPGALSVSEARKVLDYLEHTAHEVLQRLPDERYWALPQTIIHGDYHPANVKYEEASPEGPAEGQAEPGLKPARRPTPGCPVAGPAHRALLGDGPVSRAATASRGAGPAPPGETSNPGGLAEEEVASGSAIAGLFDFDWACRQARVKDLADGILFFACPRERPLAGDLAALTQAPRYDAERVRLFLETYQARLPLSEEERACLPDLLRERWLYVRLDAMHRKVQREEKLRFLLPQVTEPLKWMEGLPPGPPP